MTAGMGEMVVLVIFCLLCWRLGWTYAPSHGISLVTLLSQDFQPSYEQDGSPISDSINNSARNAGGTASLDNSRYNMRTAPSSRPRQLPPAPTGSAAGTYCDDQAEDVPPGLSIDVEMAGDSAPTRNHRVLSGQF